MIKRIIRSAGLWEGLGRTFCASTGQGVRLVRFVLKEEAIGNPDK
jgi:hypothetical protein